MNKIEKRGSITIRDGKFVVKEEQSLTDLEKYLLSRDFHGFIPILSREEGKNKYPYLEDYSLNKEQLGTDIASSLASLHNKTSFNKEVNIDKQKNIYDQIAGYITYLDEEFISILKNIEYVDFPSPSETLFMSQFSKIKESLGFCKRELDAWYEIVQNKTKERISTIHGNVCIDHALLNDRLYLTSWKESRLDIPIVDIIDFYHHDWNKLEFSSILETYLSKCELLPEEKKLLFINISLPYLPKFKKSETENVMQIRRLFDYLYKTEALIGPYYTVEDKK